VSKTGRLESGRGAVAAALAALLLFAEACTNEEARPPVPATTTQAPATSTPTATAPPSVRLDAASAIERGFHDGRPSLNGNIDGWFTEPRPAPPHEVRSPPPPQSPFAAWNSQDVVLYDVLTMTERNFGPGIAPSFSPDGLRLAWLGGVRQGPPPGTPFELRVLDLAAGHVRDLGPTRSEVRWLDNEQLVLLVSGEAAAVIVNVDTGVRRPAEETEIAAVTRVPPGDPEASMIEAGGHRLELVAQEQRNVVLRRTYRLLQVDTGATRLQFDAFQAVLAPDGGLFIATVPEAGAIEVLANEGILDSVTVNVFQVEPATGNARFIATAHPLGRHMSLAASVEHVFWAERLCSGAAARAWLYSRVDGELLEITEAWVASFTPRGTLAVGIYGTKRLVGSRTLADIVALPQAEARGLGGLATVVWAQDYRYAAVGNYGGRDFCP
jgi:hypothetical protein